MASQSPITIPGAREQVVLDPVPADVATKPELVPVPAVPVKPIIATAAISTVAFVALSLAPSVNDTVTTVQNSTGVNLLLNELFWLSAAAMGASFAMLLQVGLRATGNEERSYGIQLVVGVMTGFILVALLPAAALLGSTGVSQPTLAMLGAFFASLVFRYLPGGRTPPENGGDNATREP